MTNIAVKKSQINNKLAQYSFVYDDFSLASREKKDV